MNCPLCNKEMQSRPPSAEVDRAGGDYIYNCYWCVDHMDVSKVIFRYTKDHQLKMIWITFEDGYEFRSCRNMSPHVNGTTVYLNHNQCIRITNFTKVEPNYESIRQKIKTLLVFS